MHSCKRREDEVGIEPGETARMCRLVWWQRLITFGSSRSVMFLVKNDFMLYSCCIHAMNVYQLSHEYLNTICRSLLCFIYEEIYLKTNNNKNCKEKQTNLSYPKHQQSSYV